jgi:hypothetical protein
MGAYYFEYFQWVGYAVAGVGAWRFFPLTIIRLVAAFTNDEKRHRQCMEVLRLARRDVSGIPPYHRAEGIASDQVAETDRGSSA